MPLKIGTKPLKSLRINLTKNTQAFCGGKNAPVLKNIGELIKPRQRILLKGTT